MNKYQEALNTLVRYAHESPNVGWVLIHEENILQELVDKATLDYLNRKEKLVAGSEWVCEVECYHRYGEHDSGNIVLVSELMGGDVRYYDSRENLCEMTIDQFLVCFKPLEKGERK